MEQEPEPVVLVRFGDGGRQNRKPSLVSSHGLVSGYRELAGSWRGGGLRSEGYSLPWKSGSYLVISPHFDDAVMSCGYWIQRHRGAIVATVWSGYQQKAVAD